MKFLFKNLWTITLILLVFAFSVIGVHPAHADLPTITVTNTNDSGAGSLREAILSANPGDTINFSLSGCPCTITLTSGILAISKNLSITGTNPSSLAINGGGNSTIFSVSTLNTLNLSQLKLTGGSAGGNYGGAIYLNTDSTLNISNSVISGNSASAGGAIWSNGGTLTILNSTISNNTATSNGGGGIYANTLSANTTITNSTITGNSSIANVGAGIVNGGTMNITNSTIANNTSNSSSGGIYTAGTTTLRNTIVANNTGGNCNAAVTNGGNNLDSGTSCGFGSANSSISGTNPLLSGLANNGGATETMALGAGSLAINAGNDTVCMAAVGAPNYGAGGIDQREATRPQEGQCDIGAFEVTPIVPTLVAPVGDIGTNYNPAYTWNKIFNATYYHLYINGPSGVVLDQWLESSSICDATTCSAIPGPNTTLGGGNYSWYVQTYNPVGYGPWSNNSLPTTFSTTALTTPAAAVLTAPKNNIGTDYNPNYTWDKVASATYYRLYVSGPSGVVLDQWYPAASICPIATCSVASPSLGGGAYAWYVQTYNPIGYGPWSNNTQPTNFSTTAPTAPAAAVLTAPKNDIATNYYPTYTWGRVATATYYHLYVAGPSGVVLDQWYQASIICDATTCSVASPSLGGGAYVWYVQTYNAAGYGPWSNNTQPTNFNTSTATTPGVILTAPKNDIGTDYVPNYTWTDVDGAIYYRLYVSGPSGVVLDKWYKYDEICDPNSPYTCSVPSPALGGGAHVWYVQTYGPTGYGPWSNNAQPTNFSTTMPSAPATAVLTAPKNAIGTDYTPNYTWDKVPTATYYRLYVSGPSGVVLDQWYPVSSICKTTTCSVSSPILAGGAYVWYVQTYNAAGYGPWSNNTQPTNFNTTTPSTPVGAVLTAPSGTIPLHTPTYAWNRVSMATWYRLYIKGPSGVVKDQWYQASSVCDTTTCLVNSPTLESGFHTWWIQTYNSAGYGPWKNATFTVNP